MAKKTGEAPTISEEQDQSSEPWAPEGADRIGARPKGDAGDGERGSSVFDGDSHRGSDERGPKSGVEYYKDADPIVTGVQAHSRESASR